MQFLPYPIAANRSTGFFRPSPFMPRGLELSVPCSNPDLVNIASRFAYNGANTQRNSPWPASRGSAVARCVGPFGGGIRFDNTTSNNYIGYNLIKSANMTFEVLFRAGSSIATKQISGWNFVTDGTSAIISDCYIGFNGSSQLFFDNYDGASHKVATDTTTPFAAGGIYHAIATVDGTNAILYVNGKQTATVASASSIITTYDTGSGWVLGASDYQGGGVRASNVEIYLANYARVPWTPGEVLARFADPFAMFATDTPDMGDMFATPGAFTLPGRPTPSSTTGRSGAAGVAAFYSWRNG